MRVSTVDQHAETQLHDLRQMAAQRGFEIVREYTDRISGAKARRPGLDAMMADARHSRFDVVLVWASDRIARSVKHFLDVLDELNRLNIEYISFRENIDTGGPLGRAIVVIIGAIAELERSLIVERVRAGMRRARLEGQHIGRNPLVLDNAAIQRDRSQGQSLREIAKGHRISTATVQRVLRKNPTQAARTRRNRPVTKGLRKTHPPNPTKQMTGSDRSGRVKKYTFWNSPYDPCARQVSAAGTR
jgi:DNA invertase Pin-like site-specific DNA recombinase